MNLLNQAIKYLMVSIFIIVTIWSVIFYFSMLDEIYDSIDDGLDNYKLLILQKAEEDSTTLLKSAFDESNYAIKIIPRSKAVSVTDSYQDTLMYMMYEDDLEPVRMLTSAFEQEGKYYQLKIISSMVEEDDLINNLFWSVIGLYLVIIFSILIVNNLVLRRLWKPFYKILEQLRAFRLDRNNNLSEVKTEIKEFEELNKAAKILITNTQEAYVGQKRFTENAAHELQTPLTTIIHRLEILLNSDKLHQADAETIVKVLQTTEKLSRLNKSLLLLTKIENRQFIETTEINLKDIVVQTIEDLQDFVDYKNIRTTVEEVKSFNIIADTTMMQLLVSNLIKNGIVHNRENGEIQIKINEEFVEFKNSAMDGPLEKEKIFSRFYKGTDGSNGTGLGLALVKAVCDMYGMNIQYSYDGQHIFILKKSNKIFVSKEINSQLFPD